MTAQLSAKPSRPRDGRLDVLRGLCLLGMVLTHFLHQGLVVPGLLAETAMHWFRFAAGGFVLTSGLCLGVIHYHRALDPARRTSTHLSLLKRAGLVLLVHYFATLLSLLIIPINGWPVDNATRLLTDVLYLYTGYDLLLFYVFMLAAAPLVLEGIRRLGAWPILALSVGLFFVRFNHPYLYIWPIEQDFPLLRWQLVFVVGMVMGSKIRQFDALSAGVKWRLAGGALAVALLIAGLSALERFAGYQPGVVLSVQKLPLSITEAARYVALAVVLAVLVDRAWPWLGPSRLHRVLAVLGAQSLMLWVVHVPIVGNLAHTHWLVALPLSFVLLWGAAAGATWIAEQWNNRPSISLPRLGYAIPTVGSLALCALFLHLETPLDPPIGPEELETMMVDADSSILFEPEIESIDLFEELSPGEKSPIPLDSDSVSEIT